MQGTLWSPVRSSLPAAGSESGQSSMQTVPSTISCATPARPHAICAAARARSLGGSVHRLRSEPCAAIQRLVENRIERRGTIAKQRIAGDDHEVLPQILLDSLRLGGRFNDHRLLGEVFDFLACMRSREGDAGSSAGSSGFVANVCNRSFEHFGKLFAGVVHQTVRCDGESNEQRAGSLLDQ